MSVSRFSLSCVFYNSKSLNMFCNTINIMKFSESLRRRDNSYEHPSVFHGNYKEIVPVS